MKGKYVTVWCRSYKAKSSAILFTRWCILKIFFYFRCTLKRNISLTLLTCAIVTYPIAGNVVHTPETFNYCFVNLQGQCCKVPGSAVFAYMLFTGCCISCRAVLCLKCWERASCQSTSNASEEGADRKKTLLNQWCFLGGGEVLDCSFLRTGGLTVPYLVLD